MCWDSTFNFFCTPFSPPKVPSLVPHIGRRGCPPPNSARHRGALPVQPRADRVSAPLGPQPPHPDPRPVRVLPRGGPVCEDKTPPPLIPEYKEGLQGRGQARSNSARSWPAYARTYTAAAILGSADPPVTPDPQRKDSHWTYTSPGHPKHWQNSVGGKQSRVSNGALPLVVCLGASPFFSPEHPLGTTSRHLEFGAIRAVHIFSIPCVLLFANFRTFCTANIVFAKILRLFTDWMHFVKNLSAFFPWDQCTRTPPPSWLPLALLFRHCLPGRANGGGRRGKHRRPRPLLTSPLAPPPHAHPPLLSLPPCLGRCPRMGRAPSLCSAGEGTATVPHACCIHYDRFGALARCTAFNSEHLHCRVVFLFDLALSISLRISATESFYLCVCLFAES